MDRQPAAEFCDQVGRHRGSFQRAFDHDKPDKVLCRLWWPRFVAQIELRVPPRGVSTFGLSSSAAMPRMRSHLILTRPAGATKATFA